MDMDKVAADHRAVFVFKIEVVGDELEMSLVEGQEIQKLRRGAESGNGGGRRNRKIKREKQRRNSSGGNHHNDLNSGPHLPIILLAKGNPDDFDTVKWICTHEFQVDVEFDKDLRDPDDPTTPVRSPFGWTGRQDSSDADGVQQVTGKFTSEHHRAVKQMFYKCSVWLKNSDLELDPDVICDR